MLIRGNDIAAALASVGKKWTQQIKAEEERRSSARRRHSTMYASAQTSLKDICTENMEEAYLKASGNGSLPTSWRQVFYIMRPLVADDPRTDKRLVDTYFKTVLDEYLEDYGARLGHSAWRPRHLQGTAPCAERQRSGDEHDERP